jgi:Ser/Thr protein kinase RdoA (MazF antagonist)
VLAHYGLGRAGEPLPVTNGTLNDNHRVETNAGPVFVRRHRADRDEAHILGEHAVIAFADEHGIPVAAPLATTGGSTVVPEAGSLWAVFPWVEGRVAQRGAVTAAEAYALGEMLGRIHAAFATHPRSAAATFLMRWDKDETLRVLGACIERATQRAEPAEVLDALAFQRSLLERTPIEPPEHFAGLPCQLTHGDYHAEQVIFAPGDAVAAVADWEMYQATARAWEVIRSLSFSQVLHTPLLDDYLRGYRQHVRLGEDEIRLGVQLWWQSRVNGAWLWYACFLQGNDRVRPLFPSVVPELQRLASPQDREALTARIVAAAGV